MVTNIDTNVGKVLKALDEKGLAGNTIVVFLTDNGPAKVRFNAGLRGRERRRCTTAASASRASSAGPGISRPAASSTASPPISTWCPRLLEACGVAAPAGVRFDGKSLLPLLKGIQTAGWPDRTLFFQWHRGDQPELGRAFAARSQRYKLVRHEPPLRRAQGPAARALRHGARPARAARTSPRSTPTSLTRCTPITRRGSRTCRSTRGFEPVRIALGSPHENPTVLTRQDWRGPQPA